MQRLEAKAHVRLYAGNAHALTDWSPPVLVRRGVDDSGEPYELHERVPSAASVKVITIAGSVIRRVLYCGSGKPADNDPHRLQIEAEMLEKGNIPYGRCPKEIGLQKWLPKDIREGVPCKYAIDDDGMQHPISDEHCCECVKAVEKVRKAKQLRKCEAVNLRHRTDEARKLEIQSEQLEKTTELLDRMHRDGDNTKELQKQVAQLTAQVADLSKGKRR